MPPPSISSSSMGSEGIAPRTTSRRGCSGSASGSPPGSRGGSPSAGVAEARRRRPTPTDRPLAQAGEPVGFPVGKGGRVALCDARAPRLVRKALGGRELVVRGDRALVGGLAGMDDDGDVKRHGGPDEEVARRAPPVIGEDVRDDGTLARL